MKDVNPKVMSMVEEELRKNPGVPTKELFEKAKKADKEVASLSAREFHARYPLQVKRRNAVARRTERDEPKTAEPAPRPRGRPPGVRARKPTEDAKAAPKRGAPARAPAAGPDRAAIRTILLQFAKDIASAEDAADMVDVIGGVDKYVERVVKATGNA